MNAEEDYSQESQHIEEIHYIRKCSVHFSTQNI